MRMEHPPAASPKLYTKNPKAQLKASIDAANNKVPPSGPQASGQQGKLTRGREAKSRRGKVKPVYFWTTDDVTKWVRKYCGQLHTVYSDLFRQHEITGRTLTVMTENKLQMMGVANAQHREELMRQIVRLKLKTDTQDLKEMDQKGNKNQSTA